MKPSDLIVGRSYIIKARSPNGYPIDHIQFHYRKPQIGYWTCRTLRTLTEVIALSSVEEVYSGLLSSMVVRVKTPTGRTGYVGPHQLRKMTDKDRRRFHADQYL